MNRTGKQLSTKAANAFAGYDGLLADVVRVIEDARRAAARSVNAVMTATYWLVGKRIVEHEQFGSRRAAYGQQVLNRLSRDLLSFHRRLRCLVVIDLKLGEFTHADVGQMHLYLNYAREHWTRPAENPAVGLVLCAKQRQAVAHYALEGLANKILAAEYQTTLPDAQVLAAEMERAQLIIEERRGIVRKHNASVAGRRSRKGKR